ncbi:MAG TPA: phosphoribosylglycinamide formyltransferase [Alcanivoracaceae bacterium]|nr:phosphoribosylglycinamide formyltransferase [Alcanivoracaceae bacterium]
MSHRIAVLISGTGSNLQALLDAQAAGQLDVEFSVVLSNRADAKGLERAKKAGIPTVVVDHTQYDSRESFDAAMVQALAPYSLDTVVLAGFMRILTPVFVNHFHGRLLNIHPSLLPLYRGLHTHRRALENKDEQHGCTIHFVNNELDGGPIIAQAIVPIYSEDTESALTERVHQAEHFLYPTVLQWRAQKQLVLTDEGVTLNGKPLPQQGRTFSCVDNASGRFTANTYD